MARYYGKIGFAVSSEVKPGVWKDSIVEKPYHWSVLSTSSKWETGEGVNDDLNITNRVSIIADPFALYNFSSIKYVVYLGTKWKVSSVSVNRPRLELSIGGVYNG